ncbi:MAG TPA: hypothetical protein VMH01_11640 [Puia sp.]|nr:hypothetical protein [Puia sp.]
MSDFIPHKFARAGTIFFRTYCLYLILYFVVISDYGNYPVFWRVAAFLRRISNYLSLLLNKTFFNQNFKEVHFVDSYWMYSKLLTLLVCAVIIASIWTFADKGKGSRKLFIYMHTFSRYYLAYVLWIYGLMKIFERQFDVHQWVYLLPIGFYRPILAIWAAIAASKSYQVFGGVAEIVAASLLLFRKSTTLGALLALGLLVNILILDIGFDVPVRIIVIHLLLYNLLILWPDIVKLFRFFILRQPETLSFIPPIIENKKFHRPGYVLKFIIIAIPVILEIKLNIGFYHKENHPAYENLVGIHEIDSSYRSPAGISAKISNPKLWKKFTIERDDFFYVLYPKDSISRYFIKADTLNKILALTSLDSSSNGKLHYQKLDSAHWLFEGTYDRDSLRFITRQDDIYQHLLFKNYGKAVWSWSQSSPQIFDAR